MPLDPQISQAIVEDLLAQIVNIAGKQYENLPLHKVFLAPAWERMNENTYKAAVTHLAYCCPTLELLEWYLPVPKDPFVQGPRWRWSIIRTGKNIDVKSEFLWKDRRALSITVGSELERVIEPPCFSR